MSRRKTGELLILLKYYRRHMENQRFGTLRQILILLKLEAVIMTVGNQIFKERRYRTLILDKTSLDYIKKEKKDMKKKKSISVILIIAVYASCFSYVYGEKIAKDSSVGKDECNAVAEKLAEKNDLTDNQTKRIRSEIETLDAAGLPIKLAESISSKKNNNVYEFKVAKNVVDKVTILEDSAKTTRVQICEGKITNVLEYKATGEILVDGEKIKIINEKGEDYDKNRVSDNSFEPMVDGVTYMKKAPKEIKSWRSYRQNWICSSVSLQKKIGDLAIGVVIALLGKTTAGGVAGVFAGDALTSIKRNDPYTTGISYKIWVANSKVPATSRYTKLKKRIYSRVNFKKYSKDVIFYSRKG